VSAQILQPVDAFSNAIFNKTAGQSLKGEVVSASLVKEEGAGILVDVEFQDYDPDQEVSFRAQLMKDKRNVGSVETESNLLSESSGTVTLAINLKPSINGEAVQSDTLVIHAFKGKKLKHQYMFRLEKAWDVSGMGAGGQGSVVGLVEIKPVKVGGAPTMYQLVKMEAYVHNAAVLQQPANQPVMKKDLVVQALQQGDKYIRARRNQDLCFHKQQGNWNNGNPIHLWECSKGHEAFKSWVWERDTGYIRSTGNTAKCIVKKSNSWVNGTEMVLGDCNSGSASMKSWDYEASSGLIRARNGRSMCIHKKLNNWNNGNPLHLWKCDQGNANMKSWKISSGMVAQLPPPPTGPDQEEQPLDKEPQGPGSEVNLTGEFQGPGISDQEFLGVVVIRDENPASGVFYSVPSYYSLAWDASAGRHTVNVTYEPTVAGDESDDTVRMKMNLHASYSTKHRDLVETILEKVYPEFSELLELRGSTQVNLSEVLQLYGVDEGNIITSSVGDELTVEWKTNSVSQETLAVSFADQGLRGDVYITPEGEDKAAVPIPVHAALASAKTFGHIEWDREAGWRNSTDYPVTMNKMYAIKIQGDNLSIDTWDLGSIEVPSGAKVKWDASEVPTNLLSQSKHVWFDYGVRECQSCSETAIARIIQDIVRVPKKTLNVKVLSPIGDCGFGGAILRIRSRHLRPSQDTMETVEIDLQDDSNYEQDLFASAQQSGPPKAEYQLNAYLPSGELLTTEDWSSVNGLNLPIGSFQFSQAFGDRITCE
jgi:hypothetical protein